MFDAILTNIDKMQAIVVGISALLGAIVTLVITGIREYKRIRKEIATEEFKEIAAPFIGTAENSPLSVLNDLVNIPRTEHNIPLTQKTANTNEGKALVVAQAAIEQAKDKKPSILKKLGINSALDAVPIISGLYQGIIKPALKRK